jgi:hypothetical protein
MTKKSTVPFLGFFVAFFLAANVLDIVITIVGFQRGAYEANPFMAHIHDHYGLIAMDALKLALVGSVAWLLFRLSLRRPRWRFTLVGFGLMVLAAVELNILTIMS